MLGTGNCTITDLEISFQNRGGKRICCCIVSYLGLGLCFASPKEMVFCFLWSSLTTGSMQSDNGSVTNNVFIHASESEVIPCNQKAM